MILFVFALLFVCVISVENVVHNSWGHEVGGIGTVAKSGEVRPVQEVLAFRPFEDLNTISDSTYAVLGHPKFPKYNVRIKKSNFCDGTVR